MGWNDAYAYLRGVANKRGLAAADTPRVDDGLPLGARIGSLVRLQQAPLLRAGADGSLISLPEQADIRIVAVSHIRLNLGGRLYRYYLSTGDRDEQEKFLQVYQNAQGVVTDILFCTQLTRVIPETAEDQDAYMGASGAGLGDRSYTLNREQLAASGLDEADLQLVFGAGDGLDYWRDAGDPDIAFVPPYAGSETRIDDAAGQRGLRQEIYFMPYVRQLHGGGKEYLLITTAILTSVNGDRSRRGIHVDFVIGIPLEQERLVIQ